MKGKTVLQTSQVLFRRLCVSPAVVLPFKEAGPDSWTYLIVIGDTLEARASEKANAVC